MLKIYSVTLIISTPRNFSITLQPLINKKTKNEMKTKAKLFMILLMVFYIVPTNVAATEHHSRKLTLAKQNTRQNTTTRLPIDYTIEATGDENSLQIIFLFPMHEADITLTDKNGNVVIEENQVNSYEGKTLYVPAPKAYPYTLVLTSPAVDITGEITLEEE